MFPALFFDPLVYPLANYQQFTVFSKKAQTPCNHLNQITAIYRLFTPAYNSTPLASTIGGLYEHPTIYFVGAAFVLAMSLPEKRR